MNSFKLILTFLKFQRPRGKSKTPIPAQGMRLGEPVWFDPVLAVNWDHDALWYYEKMRWND